MVASDIHGAAHYCQEMLRAFERENANKLLLLGDILYHGPRNAIPDDYDTKDVADMLNKKKNSILCVRGNCDSDVDQMVLEFPIMAEYCLLYVGDKMIFATHGHTFNEHKLPPLTQGNILLHGHTHVPAWDNIGDFLYWNPGSVSIPKHGSRNSYMILTDKICIWKELNGEAYHSETLEVVNDANGKESTESSYQHVRLGQ